MKKSMLTLVGCVLAAGSVMAAEVTGNNIAVVIKKDAVVSSNNYQFLIVPVKGFDITGKGDTESSPLTLAELLPPAAYTPETIVYKATAPSIIYRVNEANKWVFGLNGPDAGGEEIYARDILWMQTPASNAKSVVPPTVFCGELVTDKVEVTPIAGQFVAFGNATSNAINFFEDENFVVTPQEHDEIYLIQPGSSDYLRYSYTKTRGDNEFFWRKPVPNGPAERLVKDVDMLPAGAAAYYYRKPPSKQ